MFNKKLIIVSFLFILLIVCCFVSIVYAPSVVGISTTSFATSYPFQRKTFYANGRYWVFYSDGSNLVYCTSTDGSIWTTATTVRACSRGYMFSIWYDGEYVYYVYADYSPIYYRKGALNTDGSITWYSETQLSTTYNNAFRPTIAVGTDGTIWIGYVEITTANNYYPYVLKRTSTTTITQLSTTNNTNWAVSVAPLTGGKVAVVYAYAGSTVKLRAWSGSAWLTEKATTSAIKDGCYHSVTVQGDIVHLVFLKSTGYNVLYTKYTYSSNSFSSETTLQTSATSTSAPVISIDSYTNDLYVFWAGYPTANHIFYRRFNNATSTWEARVDWVAETTALTGNERLSCSFEAYNGKITFIYMTKTASPYRVKFVFLSLLATERFYFRSDTHTVNGLPAYILNNTVSSSSKLLDVTAYSYLIFRIYKRSVSGVETYIGEQAWSYVASSTPAEYCFFWNCTETLMSPTDSIVVKLYGSSSRTGGTLLATWTTSQLGAGKLNNGTWTFHVWTHYLVTDYIYYFLFGSSTYPSRITGLSFSAPTAQWRSVESWFPVLNVLKWNGVEFWDVISKTMQYNFVELWNSVLKSLQFNFVEFWDLSFISRSWIWHSIEDWNIIFRSMQFNVVEVWNLILQTVHVADWYFVEAWNIIFSPVTVWTFSFPKVLLYVGLTSLLIFLAWEEDRSAKRKSVSI